jgi:hypothetical protein
MTRAAIRTSQATILAILLYGSSVAVAQVKWCCENPQHAGDTAKERCENNRMTLSKVEECTAHKADHDKNTGHKSTCGSEVEQTRTGTVKKGRSRRR